MLIGACVHMNTRVHKCAHAHFHAHIRTVIRVVLWRRARAWGRSLAVDEVCQTPTCPLSHTRTDTYSRGKPVLVRLKPQGTGLSNSVGCFPWPWPLSLACPNMHAQKPTHTYTHASTQPQAPPSTPPLTHTLTRKQTKAKGDSTYLIPFKEPASGPPGQTCVRGHCHTVHSVSIYRNTHTGVGANEWYAHPPVWRRQHAASDSSLAGPRGRLERYEEVGNRSSVCWIFARADELCGSGDGRNESGAGQCLCGRGTPDHQRRTRGEEPRLKASDAA